MTNAAAPARLRYLHEAADVVAQTLRSAGLPAQVAAVTEPGYSVLTAPFVAVDAPSIEEWAGYLNAISVGSEPYALMSVPVRVVPADSADAAGLISLTDHVLTVLADAAEDGFTVTSVLPAMTLGNGTTGKMPAYKINVRLTVIP